MESYKARPLRILLGVKLQLKFVAKSFNLKSTKALLMSKFIITSLIRFWNHARFLEKKIEHIHLERVSFSPFLHFSSRERFILFPRLILPATT